jgi:hypothetical protein
LILQADVPFDIGVLDKRGSDPSDLLLEMRGGDLYMGGRRISRTLSPKQKPEERRSPCFRKPTFPTGNDLRREMQNPRAISPFIFPTIRDEKELFPKGWGDGFTYAWQDLFRRGDVLYVACICKSDGIVRIDFQYLGGLWQGHDYAAQLE